MTETDQDQLLKLKPLWQEYFMSPKALIYFWSPTFRNLGLPVFPPAEKGRGWGWDCAYKSSFGRYIKWLTQWYTMYVKSFYFLFKLMFLRKNCRIEKNWNSFAAAPQEKKNKILPLPPPPPYKKEGSCRQQRIVLYPEVFLHILVYIFTL